MQFRRSLHVHFLSSLHNPEIAFFVVFSAAVASPIVKPSSVTFFSGLFEGDTSELSIKGDHTHPFKYLKTSLRLIFCPYINIPVLNIFAESLITMITAIVSIARLATSS